MRRPGASKEDHRTSLNGLRHGLRLLPPLALALALALGRRRRDRRRDRPFVDARLARHGRADAKRTVAAIHRHVVVVLGVHGATLALAVDRRGQGKLLLVALCTINRPVGSTKPVDRARAALIDRRRRPRHVLRLGLGRLGLCVLVLLVFVLLERARRALVLVSQHEPLHAPTVAPRLDFVPLALARAPRPRARA